MKTAHSGLAGLCLLLMGFSWAGPVMADDQPMTITVSGEAILVENNLPQARQHALREAFSAALTQLLGSYINAESYTRNYESIERGVYSKTQGYVKNYQVLKESVNDELLIITVQVTVMTKPVLDDLTALGIILQAVGNPVVLVQGDDEGLVDSQSTQFFKQILAEKGFQVIQSDPSQADIIVRLTGRIRNQSELNSMHGAIATVEATAHWSNNNRLIATRSSMGNGAGLNDTAALKAAYTKAAATLFPDFLKSTLTRWQDEANNGHPIEVIVANADYRQAQLLRSRFAKLLGVKKATLKGFSGDLASFILDFSGNVDLLAEMIERTHYQNIALQITRLEVDRLFLKAGVNR
ncbi:MAG: flagellar assembly protein T N-terminal domain-containing protein [Candidatus Contendobacter sp.]|nr:flagellar assembly protein T N-terminal domain-containing protein [Candidatus Contendobacter sp.]